MNKADQHKNNSEMEEAEMMSVKGEQTSPVIAELLQLSAMATQPWFKKFWRTSLNKISWKSNCKRFDLLTLKENMLEF